MARFAYTSTVTGPVRPGYADAREQAFARGNTAGLQKTVHSVKKSGCAIIDRAGLGPKIAKALRGATDPKIGGPPKLNPRGAVFSKAIYKDRKGGLVDLITAFRIGYVINDQVYVPAKWVGRVSPKNYGGKTVTIWASRKGRGRPKAVRVLGWVIDVEKHQVAYTIMSGLRQKATLKGIDRLFARANALLAKNQNAANERDLKKVARATGVTVVRVA